MCENCEPISLVIKKFAEEKYCSNLYRKYMPAINTLNDFIKADVLELYAGDGPLETIPEYFDTSLDSSIVMHYFRCRNCGQFFTAGIYARGKPLMQVTEPPSQQRLNNLCGKEGVYFQDKG